MGEGVGGGGRVGTKTNKETNKKPLISVHSKKLFNQKIIIEKLDTNKKNNLINHVSIDSWKVSNGIRKRLSE